MVIFEESQYQRTAHTQQIQIDDVEDMPAEFLREKPPLLPEVSELQTVRHFTKLSQKNFSIDGEFYPLGSCTMKYNPMIAHKIANMNGFADLHPLLPENASQGLLSCINDLQNYLCEMTGMQEASLTPMAGSQGELAGCAMIRAYHLERGDVARTEILIPDAAHGTNPATAVMCGFKVKEIPTNAEGDVDIEGLQAQLGPHTAGIMLTNPSTLGVFTRNIHKVAAMVHQAGGLLYYDGANFNAILGKVKPGDMGFDVMHLNLHKTFATPHGGGGPGSGPVLAGKRLQAYLPTPMVGMQDGKYVWLNMQDRPKSIGRLSAFQGNTMVLLRAYIYIRLLGRTGLTEVANLATLNANYLMKRLGQAGFTIFYGNRRASHEFIVTFKYEKQTYGISAMDVAKRLLDYGFHAPTTYFPLLVPECFLIEPTETECKMELDHFVEAMVAIREEMKKNPEILTSAPHTLPVKRLDEVKAARELDLVWNNDETHS